MANERNTPSTQDAKAAAAALAAGPAKTGETVTIACKIPNGLLLRVFRRVPHQVPVLGGGVREEMKAEMIGEPVHVHGPAAPFGAFPKAPVAGGFALTQNVSKEFWELWLEQNASHPAVKNGLIYATSSSHAEGAAKERKDLLTGFEPLDVESGNDPRVPRRIKKDDGKAA
jgi:hypothetical protein